MRARVCMFVGTREDGKQSAAGAIMHNGGRNLHGGSFIINLAAPLGDSPVPYLHNTDPHGSRMETLPW